MTPWQIATSNSSEHVQQVAFFAWARKARFVGFALAWQPDSYLTIPPREALAPVPILDLLHAIPNGGERNGAVAGRMKAEGTRSGVPDTFLPWPGRYGVGLYLEFKVGKNQLSAEQRKFFAAVQQVNYGAFEVRSWEAAAKYVQAHLS
jgi:hypothetical protein